MKFLSLLNNSSSTEQKGMNQKGFSLIELMIVVAIIGILSAIAIPNYQKFQRKSRQAEAKSMASSIYTTMRSYEAEWGQPVTSFVAVGFQPDGRIVYNCGFGGGGGALAPRHLAAVGAAPAGAAIDNTRAACPGGVGAVPQFPNCSNGSGDFGAATGAAPVGSANVVAAGGNFTFTIACEANIGGNVSDRWTLNNAKTLANTQDGT